MNRLRATLAKVLGRLYGGRTGQDDAFPDVWDRPEPPEAEPGGVRLFLEEIEQLALEIYAAHDLPTRPGQYARSPRGRVWKFIGETLSAEERWSLALENGSTAGWKFRALEDLGAAEDHDENEDLARASEMLRTCRALRASARATPSKAFSEDIARAIRLGAHWQQTQMMADRRKFGGLRFNTARGSSGQPAPARKPHPRKR